MTFRPASNKVFVTRGRVMAPVLFVVHLFHAGACAEITPEAMRPLRDGLSTISIPASADTSEKAAVPVDVYVPPGKRPSGDVLVLPGWNFSRTEWHTKTTILILARERRLRMVFPDMLKTLYESRYFPETRMKWGPTPGGQWIRTIFIPAMREYGIFREEGANYLLGLSTGGRGVALVSLDNPGLFRAGAALSGDFDQSAMKRDRLMAAVYGPYDRFAERWTSIDNPSARILEWRMPIYLGHGKRDAVVPFDQTVAFYKALTAARPGLPLTLSAPENAGHDFAYWQSELDKAFDFMLSIR